MIPEAYKPMLFSTNTAILLNEGATKPEFGLITDRDANASFCFHYYLFQYLMVAKMSNNENVMHTVMNLDISQE